MSDNSGDSTADDPLTELRTRAEALERQLRDVQLLAENRLIKAELKAEAIRAGIIDLDCLRLLDTTDLKISQDGDVEGAGRVMLQLKKSKPWLFSNVTSSSPSTPPPAQPSRQKLATEMSETEYLSARDALLRAYD